MSRITIISAFSSSTPYLPRYFAQVEALQLAAAMYDVSIHLLLVEGDSKDDTAEQLTRRLSTWPGSQLIRRHHGNHVWHSVDIPERMANLAYVFNGGLEAVTPSDSFVAYIDSDLIWKPEVVVSLWRTLLQRQDMDILGPMTMAAEAMYDIWGLRDLSGASWGPFPQLTNLDPVEVSSIGAFFLMRGGVAMRCRMQHTDHVVGFCREARRKGYRVWVDPAQRVNHP